MDGSVKSESSQALTLFKHHKKNSLDVNTKNKTCML